MTPLKPLTKENASRNGAASTEDLVRLSSSVLGAVGQIRVDINRRFEETNAKLDSVCDTVGGIVTARAIEAALKAQTREITDAQAAEGGRHELSKNQRLAVLVAAFSAVAAAVLGFLNLLAGH
jgi:hypothetical protein